jgi:LysM repeat protein
MNVARTCLVGASMAVALTVLGGCGGDNGKTARTTVAKAKAKAPVTTARKTLPTVGRTTTTRKAVTRPGEYIVKRGDSLSKIANQFGVSVAALVQANGIKDPNMIIEGQRLKIPAKTTTTT